MPQVFAPPLAANSIVWTPAKYDYSALTASTLGNAADPSDGFDSVLLSAANFLSTVLQSHDSLSIWLMDLAASEQIIGSIPTADLTDAIAVATKADAPALDTIGKMISGLLFNPAAAAGFAPAPLPPAITGAGIGSTAGGSGVSIGDASAAGLISGTIGTAAAIGAHLAIAGSALAGVLSTAAVVVPIIGAVVAVGLLLLHYFGGGCGTACTDAARAEQIYEAAADNVYAVAKAGMLSKTHALYAMHNWITAGQQHLAQFNTEQARKGATNLVNVINAEIAAVNALPPTALKPLDITKARALYLTGGNWYYESLQAAAQLTDAYLENLPQL